MSKISADEIRQFVGSLYRTDARRVFATLVRLLSDFELAEEVLHDAFASALEQWPRDGVPNNPRAWLVSAGRFKSIDAIRRRARFDASLEGLAKRLDTSDSNDIASQLDGTIEDDRLRLIFTCCHPALPAEARVPLTLREVCGLTTEEIARAFLSSPSTIAQRIVRAKAKIREAKIPYEVPSKDDLPERLETVLSVIYLVFNEGYSASSGDSVTRPDLSSEAIRLGRLLAELLPDAEVIGLLALMLLHESRHAARSTPEGEIVLLQEQDRGLWNREQIAEGVQLVSRVLESGQIGPYGLQAAISAVHASAPTAVETNWARIVDLYDGAAVGGPLAGGRIESSRGRGDARWSRGGPEFDRPDSRTRPFGRLSFGDAARADLCRRLGRVDAARSAYCAGTFARAPGTGKTVLGKALGGNWLIK